MAIVATSTPDLALETPAPVTMHPQMAGTGIPQTLKFAAHVLEEEPEDSGSDEDHDAESFVPKQRAGTAPPNLARRDTVRIKTRFPVALENLPVGKLFKLDAEDESSFACGSDAAKSFSAFVTVFSGTKLDMTPEAAHVVHVSKALGNLDCVGLSSMTDTDIKVEEYTLPEGWSGLLFVDDDTKRLLATGVKHTFQGSVMDMSDVLRAWPDFVEKWVAHTKATYVDPDSGRTRDNARATLNKRYAKKCKKQGKHANPLDYAMANLVLTHKVFVCTRLILHPEDDAVYIPEDFVQEIRERMITTGGAQIPADTHAAVRRLNEKIDAMVGDIHIGDKIPVYVGAEVRATVGMTTAEHNEKAFGRIIEASEGSYHVARQVCQVIGELETMGEIRNVFDNSICFETMEEAVAFIAAQPAATRSMYEVRNMADEVLKLASEEDADADSDNEAGPSE